MKLELEHQNDEGNIAYSPNAKYPGLQHQVYVGLPMEELSSYVPPEVMNLDQKKLASDPKPKTDA